MADVEKYIGESELQDRPVKKLKLVIKEGAISTRLLADQSVTTEKIQDGAVVNSKLADESVTTEKIKNGNVTTDKILDDSVVTEKIADNAVITSKIKDGAVTTSKILDSNITTDKIASGAVTADKILNDSVTSDKIQEGTIVGRNIAEQAITGTHIQDDAIESKHIKDNSIPGSKLKDGTIESVDIKDNSLEGSKLVDNSIPGSKIADSAIESRHLKDNSIPASKILDGTIESIDIKDGTLDGSKIKDNTITSTKLADNAITPNKIIDASITTDKIGNLAVTEGKIGNSAITNTKIANEAVTTDKINNGAVTTDKIPDNSIITSKIADSAVTTSKIADSNVTTAKIADLNVTTAKIADSAVTEDKLADGAITPDKIADSTITELQTIMDEVPTEGSVKPVMSGGVAPIGAKTYELDADINGINIPETTMYEGTKTITAYGNTQIGVLTGFITGRVYRLVSPNGIIRLQALLSSDWETITTLELGNDGKFEWIDGYDGKTFRIVSRESEEKTFNVSIVSEEINTEGLKDEVSLIKQDLLSIGQTLNGQRNDLLSIEKRFPEVNGRSLFIEGASFVDWNYGLGGDNVNNPGNGWFELACDRLSLQPINKARSGSSIVDVARGISGNSDSSGHIVNAPWNDEEFEEFDVLCLMHVHNYNVCDESVLKTDYDGTEAFLNTELKSTSKVGYICTNLIPEYYAQAYDYVLKEYAKQCYACKDKVGSRWYGTKMGKPFKVVVCTHWHDARITFNTSIRALANKWGLHLVEFDKNIGFCKDSVCPATGQQWSILYCDNVNANTEVIGGVTYGWHQTRGKDAYIQKNMANIFSESIKIIISDGDFSK